MTRKSLGSNPAETAEQMAATWLRNRLDAEDLSYALDTGDADRTFGALCAQLEAADTSGRLMDTDLWLEATARVRESLPNDAMKKLHFRCQEHNEERDTLRADAAFLFGLALGRRLGSVR